MKVYNQVSHVIEIEIWGIKHTAHQVNTEGSLMTHQVCNWLFIVPQKPLHPMSKEVVDTEDLDVAALHFYSSGCQVSDYTCNESVFIFRS